MRVHHHAFVPRKNSRVSHQITGDGKRATRGDADTGHGTRRGIMESIDHANAVFEDGSFVFNQCVRRQATVAFANAHRAAGRMETHPDITGRGNRVIQP